MGQRHNRRRTRPRSRNRSTDVACSPVNSLAYPVAAGQSVPPCDSLDSIPTACAPSWHYGSTVWQTRERTLQLESTQLEAEQCRLFGGEPGDDVGLCYRMLEYFGGLDYIDL